MDDIFASAKSILVVWAPDVNPENLPMFQEKIQTKAKQARIAFENVEMLSESQRLSSSFDLILFGLVSKRDTQITIDILNELFRLLGPMGYLISHVEHTKQSQTIDLFKMCGFSSCNPLDANSSFLIENKDDNVKKLGSLWLCQKPSFDIGYSVPLRSTTDTRMGQTSSSTAGEKKTWTMEDDDLIDTDELLDENDRKKPDVKKYDCGTTSTGVRKACKNCTCGLAQELEQEEHTTAKETVKSSCGSCYLGDAFRCAGCPSRGLPPFKPGERVTVPNMSDPLVCTVIPDSYGKRVMCYYTNWSGYRPSDGRFSIQDIDPSLCTHIIYSFASVRGNDLGTTEGSDPENYKQILALKEKNPDLKVMLAVGGWNHGSGPFTQMVATEKSRQEFVENSYNFLKKYGFDGLDLDWEYPADRGSPYDDRHRFTQLVEQLSEKYKPEGLLLSAATPASPSRYDGSYEPEICKHLDFINMMTYDYTGQWERTAGHNSPLTSQKETVQHMLKKQDCTPDKLNLGMGAYGRTHQLADPSANGIGSPTVGSGAMAGAYTGESGFMSYYEVCQKLKEGWTKEWSNQHQVPYAYSGSNWVGYDDTESIALKAEYVNEMDLGGAMFWAMDLDDFRGEKCGEGKFPLINTAKDIVNGKAPSTRSTTTRTTPTTTPKPDQSDTAALYCQYCNYYECLTTPSGKQITVSRTCPTPLIYSEDKKKCVKEKELSDVQIKCSTKSRLLTTPIASTNCWDPSSFVTDSMCRFFTDCSNKRRYECPPDSSFALSVKRCVPKQNVNQLDNLQQDAIQQLIMNYMTTPEQSLFNENDLESLLKPTVQRRFCCMSPLSGRKRFIRDLARKQ
ncbi:unnamed protein product [Rotaria sp. Silwood2]|nr:unnamed protein product [Rotaria sp. Silwood2]CAF3986132.1 unnamed protein product [Rotaria sp. Silwood2]CAF4206472.1 unnamed protein product [Rotaria sp. Silwood2]